MEIHNSITSSESGVVDMNALKSMMNNPNVSRNEKLGEASRQFESILLKTYLKDSLKPLVKGFLDESGSMHGIYRHMVTDILADSLSKSEAFGFSTMVQAQLQHKTPEGEGKEDLESNEGGK